VLPLADTCSHRLLRKSRTQVCVGRHFTDWDKHSQRSTRAEGCADQEVLFLRPTPQLLTIMEPGSFSFAPAQRFGLSTRIVPYTIHHAAARTPDNSLITDDITEDTDDEESCGRGCIGTRRVTRPVFPWRMDRRDCPQQSLSHASDGGGASHMEEHACAALVRMRAWPSTTTTRNERCDSVMSGMCASPARPRRTPLINMLASGTTVDSADAEYAPALANSLW
jgi:hypothetical protein